MEELKKLLTSDKFLVHYDSSCELSLTCDASVHGLGSVLSHKMPDGSDKPTGYASRTLNAAEQQLAAGLRVIKNCYVNPIIVGIWYDKDTPAQET